MLRWTWRVSSWSFNLFPEWPPLMFHRKQMHATFVLTVRKVEHQKEHAWLFSEVCYFCQKQWSKTNVRILDQLKRAPCLCSGKLSWGSESLLVCRSNRENWYIWPREVSLQCTFRVSRVCFAVWWSTVIVFEQFSLTTVPEIAGGIYSGISFSLSGAGKCRRKNEPDLRRDYGIWISSVIAEKLHYRDLECCSISKSSGIYLRVRGYQNSPC